MATALLDALREACAEVGIVFRDVPADGRFHPTDIEGDRHGRGDGRIRLFRDGAGGIVWNWKREFKVFFVANRGSLNETERRELRTRRARAIRQTKEDDNRRRVQARHKSAAIWATARPATTDHPYLVRKSVSPVATLREIDAGAVTEILGYAPRSRDELLTGRLLVAPVEKMGNTVSTVELIDEAGRKSAIAGGAKAGGYWAAQAMPGGDGAGLTLQIGEGVATVLSAMQATQHPSVAALSCGNLPLVAKAMRDRYPAATLIILADLGNGQKDAKEASRLVGGLLAIPEFEAERPSALTDFNDLAVHCGLEAVKRAIENARCQGPPPRTSEQMQEFLMPVAIGADSSGNQNETLTEKSAIPVELRPDSFLDRYICYGETCLPGIPRDYHLLVGLTVQAAVLGHKVTTNTDLQTNLAGIIVTVQGMGKSATTGTGIDLLECLRSPLEPCDHTPEKSLLIATQASVEGFLEALQEMPSGLVDFDEFTAFLKDCRREHMGAAKENFCRALDGRQIKYRRARGQNVNVEKPCPSIIGTTNVVPLRAVTTKEDLVSGMYSRLLFCAPDIDYDASLVKPGDPELKKQLVEQLRWWFAMSAQTAQISEEVYTIFENYGYQISPYKKGEHIDLSLIAEETAGAAYVRYRTHAIKVAVLLCAGETPGVESIVVTPDHAQRAIQIVERFRHYAERLSTMFEETDEARLIHRIRRYLRAAPGHTMKVAELHRKLGGKTKATELKRVLDSLYSLGSLKLSKNAVTWLGE